MKKPGLILVFLLAILLIWSFTTYNRIVTLEASIPIAWSQVENVYQRRLDLIPNLVKTVKAYAAHEKDTLEAVIQARNQASQISPEALKNVLNDPQAFAKFQESQTALSSSLSKLMVVVEKYPDLKANQNFLELQAQLEGTENRITVERKKYNEAVGEYNIAIRRFPGFLVAKFLGFQPKDIYFKADAGASKAPEVNF